MRHSLPSAQPAGPLSQYTVGDRALHAECDNQADERQALSMRDGHGKLLLLCRPSRRFHQRGQHELDKALWVICVHLRQKER